MSKKVAFLDRDGTINVDHGFVYSVAAWQFVSGAIEGMQKLQEAGFTLAVVTNQSGIGHELYTQDDMQILHQYMLAELKKESVEIAAIAFCPHRRDKKMCDCRKPQPGMAKQIEKIIGEIDYKNSWTIGDKEADVGFGKNAGTHTAIIKSAYWQENNLELKPDIVAESLLDAVEKIIT